METLPGKLSDQTIVCVVPDCQLSPPFGEETVMKPWGNIWGNIFGKIARSAIKLKK